MKQIIKAILLVFGFSCVISIIPIVAGVSIIYGLEKRYERTHQEHKEKLFTEPIEVVYE